jgi:hypothetical protein
MSLHKFSWPLLAASLWLAVTVPASAQLTSTSQSAAPSTSIDRSFNASPKDCADVHWSSTAVQRFPSIAQACQGVEQRNGKSYVRFEGVVEDAKDRGRRIRVDFEDGEDLTFAPPPQTVLYLDGKRTSFADVQGGMRLNFYVPEDRLQAEFQPDPARVAFIIFPFDLPVVVPPSTQSVAESDQARTDRQAMSARNELPETASLWPYVGLGGVVLLLVAAALTNGRKRPDRTHWIGN